MKQGGPVGGRGALREIVLNEKTLSKGSTRRGGSYLISPGHGGGCGVCVGGGGGSL